MTGSVSCVQTWLIFTRQEWNVCKQRGKRRGKCCFSLHHCLVGVNHLIKPGPALDAVPQWNLVQRKHPAACFTSDSHHLELFCVLRKSSLSPLMCIGLVRQSTLTYEPGLVWLELIQHLNTHTDDYMSNIDLHRSTSEVTNPRWGSQILWEGPGPPKSY